MLKVGLIGCGFMGNTHSEVYRLLTSSLDISLYGVCDIRAEQANKVSKIHGAKIYDSYEELIADSDIDVIDICVPTYIHAKVATLAMESGKSVFIEKPVVLTPEEGEKLLEVQKKTGAKVMVGQCIRMWPAYTYLKKIFDGKEYGNLKSLVLKRVSPIPTWSYENWYLDPKKCGGAELDLHIHDVDFMRYLLGEPKGIFTLGYYDHVHTLFEYDGIAVETEGGWDYPSNFPFAMEYRANFEKATATYVNGEINLYLKDGRQFVIEQDDNIEDKDLGGNVSDLGGYYNELKYFYECLINNEEILVAPLCEGVASVKLIYEEKAKGGF